MTLQDIIFDRPNGFAASPGVNGIWSWAQSRRAVTAMSKAYAMTE
jgi:hypothetical protein